MEPIATNIKQLIKNQGITQIEFCNMLGITKQAFYEQMRANSLTTIILERYANALNVPLWRLFVTPEEVKGYLNNNTESNENKTTQTGTDIVCPYCNKSIKLHITTEI